MAVNDKILLYVKIKGKIYKQIYTRLTSTGLSFLRVNVIHLFSDIPIVPKSNCPLYFSGLCGIT